MKTKTKRSPARLAIKSTRPRPADRVPSPGVVSKRNGTPAAPRPVVPLKERRLVFGAKWDYAPAPEMFEYIKIAPRHELFIDGKFTPPSTGKYFDSINPATEDTLSEVALSAEQDVDLAIKVARRAYENVWSKLPGRERGKYIY